jgi:hypothetical protein
LRFQREGEKQNEDSEKKERKWKTIQRGKEYEIKNTTKEGEYTVVAGINGDHKKSVKKRGNEDDSRRRTGA